MDRTTSKPYADLLRGADGGAYTLPKTVDVARRGVDELARAIATVAGTAVPEVVRADRAESIVEQAIAEGRLPDDYGVDDVIAARAAVERRDDVLAMLTLAHEGAVDRFRAIVAEHSDTIVVDHLRPAFDQVLTTLRRIAPKLAGMPIAGDTGARAWRDADSPQRAAYRALDELVPRLAMIRAGHSDVLNGQWRASGGEHGIGVFGHQPESAIYRSIRNVDALWPPKTRRRDAAPWPTEPREHALWLVAGEAEPWLPTFAEETAVYRAAEVDRMAQRPPFIGASTRAAAPAGHDVSTRPDISSRRVGGSADRPTRIRVPSE